MNGSSTRRDRRLKTKTKTINQDDDRRRQRRQQQQEDEEEDEDEEEEESQTVREILFGVPPQPGPDDDIEEQKTIRYPKTYREWKSVFSSSWKIYWGTFEGLLYSEEVKSKPTMDERIANERRTNDDHHHHHEDDDHHHDNVDEQFSDLIKEKMKENVSKNVEFIRDETSKVVSNVQRQTGIYRREDLKHWAADQMKLATECLNQFMAGYRNGRDDEVDKMMNEYFQEENDQNHHHDDHVDHVDKEGRRRKRKRKPKRRIRTAL